MSVAIATSDGIGKAPLSALRSGAGENAVNCRKTGKTDDLTGLKNNIRHFIQMHRGHSGLIQALAVQRQDDGTYRVIDGDRRLAALEQLRDDGVITEDHQVPIIEHDVGWNTIGMSLAANITALPLHPVDQYEAFASLIEQGQNEAEIAAAFAIKPIQVKQKLALGKLSAKIRKAWRDGVIGAEEAEVFTLIKEPNAQDKVFNRVKKECRDVRAWQVRQYILDGQKNARGLLKTVGQKAYEEAGGVVTRDLFSSDVVMVSDIALLKSMFEDTVDASLQALIDDGWAWACREDDLPDDHWNWERIPPRPKYTPDEKTEIAELKALKRDAADYWEENQIERSIERIRQAAGIRSASARSKARSGCMLRITHDGELVAQCGLIRPADAPVATAEKEKKSQPEKPPVSNALAERLSRQITLAAAKSLLQDPRIAVALLLAGMDSSGWDNPMKARVEGMAHAEMNLLSGSQFQDKLKNALKLDQKGQESLLAGAAACAVDMVCRNANGLPTETKFGTAVLEAITAELFNPAIQESFDAEDYFKSVNAVAVKAAITDVLGLEETNKAPKKKADLIAFALTNLKDSGWLPPELRTVHYDGPGANLRRAEKG